MARITVEDCLEKLGNQFKVVQVAGHRARQLEIGMPAKVEEDGDKSTVIALREIAEGLITEEVLDEPVGEFNDLDSELSHLLRVDAPGPTIDDSSDEDDEASEDDEALLTLADDPQAGTVQGVATQSVAVRGGDAQADVAQGVAAQGDDTQAGDAQAGDAQAGDAQAGTAQAGDAQAGDAQAGTAQAGTAQGGDARAGDAQGGDTRQPAEE